MKAMF